MASIKIRPAGDGTYILYRNGDVISAGLTRRQADELAVVLRTLEG